MIRGNVILIASTVTELNTHLEVVNTFSEWSDIRLNITQMQIDRLHSLTPTFQMKY